jgi:hypothetical protein
MLMCNLFPLVLSLQHVDLLSMNTVTRGCIGTFRGRRLVPGGLDVPALDRNQSPLPFPFHIAFRSLIHSSSTAHKGGDPRQELTIPPFPLNLASVHSTCAHPAFVQWTLHPSMLALIQRCVVPCSLYPTSRACTSYPASSRICMFLRMRINHPYIAPLAVFFVSRDTRSTGHHRKPCCSMDC